MNQIHYLVTGGMYMNARVCEVLILTALDMIKVGSGTRRFSAEEVETVGEVRTRFEVVTLETISGILFEATIERGPHTGNIRFIVSGLHGNDADIPLSRPYFN